MYFALCCTHSVVQATVWQALSACSTKVAGPHAYCKAREACRHTSTSELYEAVAACASRLPLCTAGHVRMPGVEPGSQAWEACIMPLHYMRFVGGAGTCVYGAVITTVLTPRIRTGTYPQAGTCIAWPF